MAGVKTLVSAAVYATLIVTFGFQVARVDGLSMAPTLEDHDRLIVNKLVYELGDPRPGDIVMLYYPLNPEKMFVKRVIAKEGDTVRIVDGHVVRQRHPAARRLRPAGIPQPRRLGPAGRAAGLLLRHGRSPQQQLRQPPLGTGAEEVHRRQGEGALVAPPGRQDLLACELRTPASSSSRPPSCCLRSTDASRRSAEVLALQRRRRAAGARDRSRSASPRVVALERLFAATPRGAALINRIKADPHSSRSRSASSRTTATTRACRRGRQRRHRSGRSISAARGARRASRCGPKAPSPSTRQRRRSSISRRSARRS